MSKKEDNDILKKIWREESAVFGIVCCIVGWFVLGGLCAILAIIFGATALKSDDLKTRTVGIIDIVVGVLMMVVLLSSLVH